MKRTYKIFLLLFAGVTLAGTACRKMPDDIDLEKASAKQKELQASTQKLLSDPGGWMLYVPNRDTSIKTAVPLYLRFNPDSGVCNIRSIFPIAENKKDLVAFYELNSGTGVPLLSFATGSVFTYLYELGVTTDNFFRINSISPDTILLQPYRSGGTFSKEGGIPMKMIRQKTPPVLFNISPLEIANTLNNSSIDGGGDLRFHSLVVTYKNGYTSKAMNTAIVRNDPGDEAFFFDNVSTSKDLQMLSLLMMVGDGNTQSFVYSGNSSIFLNVDKGWQPVPMFQTLPQAYIRNLKSTYLLVRNIDKVNKVMNLYALDGDGQEIMTGTLPIDL